jgi:hypothetical protein
MTGEQLHNPKGFDSASNNTTMVKDGSGSVLWAAQTDLPQALNIVSPQSAPPTENSGDVYLMDTTGTAYDINTITWQSGNTIRIAFNGSPDLSAVAADDYFVTSGNANSSNDGTFQISAVNDGSDYIDIINLNRSDATDDEATDAIGTGYYTLEEWDGVSKNMHVRFDGTSWISVTPSAGYTCYDITSGNILIFNGTDWSTNITTSASGGLNNVVEDTTPQLGGDLDVQTNEIVSTGSNNIGLHSNASAYVELGDNLGSNAFDIRDNASGIKAQILSTGDMGVGKSTSLSTAWISISSSNNNRAHINFEGSASDKTTPVDGDLWYNTTTGALNFYDGTTTTDLLAGGGGGLANVVDDTTPQLGGTLDANTFNIGFDDLTGIEDSAGNEMLIFNSNASAVNYLQINNSATGGNVGITALGTDTNINVNIQAKNAGNITLGNFTFDADQTVGAGQDNYVLTYDNASGLISLEASAGGGSSEWADNGDGGISFDGTASGTKRYIEINDGTAFNPSGNITQGMIVVGDLHTSTNLIRRGMIFGYSNSMATTGTATGEVIFGNTCTTEGGQYNIVTGYLNTMKSGKNYSATFGSQNTNNGTDSFIAGNLNTVNNDNQAIIGWSNKTQSGVPYQMLFGLGMQATSNHGNRMIGFGMGSSRPNAGFVNGDTLTALNFAMGSDSALRTLDGAGLSGSGAGVMYWMRKNVTAPTVNVADAVAGYAVDRIAGDCGLVIKSENGTKHMFAGVVGINTTTPNANCAIDIEGVAKVKSYTVATVPTAVVGGIIYVSDETGGATLAFSDGTNWRRTSDLAVVS